MSDSGAHRPAGAGATDAPDRSAHHGALETGRDDPGAPRGRRWPWILLVVLGAAAVVVAILLLTNERQPPEAAPTLDPEIVTLPVPTPTVDPVELPEGSTFFEALPRTVLQFAVTEAGEAPELRQAGALEAYRLEFDDGGGTGFTLQASQWRTAEDAGQRLADVVVAQAADAGVDPAAPGTATAPADPADPADPNDPATEPRLEQGVVVVDDVEVGSYLLRVRDDGTARVWWTNATALFSLDGPSDTLRDVYAGFPL